MAGQQKIACSHVDHIRPVKPRSAGCEKCVAAGDTWVSLRLCLSCGHVGCCDQSKNKHATKHFKATGHPIMRGYKTKRRFRWCYLDKAEV